MVSNKIVEDITKLKISSSYACRLLILLFFISCRINFLHHGLFTLIMLHPWCNQVDRSKLYGLAEEFANRTCTEESSIFWILLTLIQSVRMLPRRKPYRMWQTDSMTIKYIMLASMSNKLYKVNIRKWIYPPYSLISRSYIENRAELLDTSYLSSCSELRWQKALLFKPMC